MFGDKSIEDRLEDIEISTSDEKMTALELLEDLEDEEIRKILSDALKIWRRENEKETG